MWFLPARPTRRSTASARRRVSYRPGFEVLEDRKLLTAGLLDATFGTGGKVVGNFGTATASFTSTSKDFALARYNADGSLDSTFGSGGKVATAFTTSVEPTDQALLPAQGV